MRRSRGARAAGALVGAAAVFGACAVSLVCGAARAEGEGRAAAATGCARGEEAAKGLRFAEALEAYRAAIAADPSAPCASMARNRADDLAVHAEGGFVPLARVEALRRDRRKAVDRAEIEALTRDLEAFPDGRVRAEARLLVAEAWWHALGDPARAITAFEGAVGDPSGDKLTRALALAQLWTLRRDRGEVREALAEVERDPDLSPKLTELVRKAARREWLRANACDRVSLGALSRWSGRRRWRGWRRGRATCATCRGRCCGRSRRRSRSTSAARGRRWCGSTAEATRGPSSGSASACWRSW